MMGPQATPAPQVEENVTIEEDIINPTVVKRNFESIAFVYAYCVTLEKATSSSLAVS